MKKVYLLILALLSFFVGSLQAQTAIYSCDFENSTQDTSWHFVNGSPNGWFIGSAADANNTAGGSRAIYVSNDNGTTNAYSTSTSSSVYSWAYLDVAIPTGYAELTLEFDWKCYGESSYDYMKVYVGAPSIPSGSTAPTQTTTLVNDLRTYNNTYFNGYDGDSYNLYPGWHHYSYTFFASQYSGQTVRLYLYWKNDTGGGDNPPMTVDNIALTGNTCGSVQNLSAVPTSTDMTATFSPSLSTDNAWEYVCVLADSSITNETPVSVADTFFTVNNLLPDTKYDIYVRTNCGTENSTWKKITKYTTQIPTTLPYNHGFENTAENGNWGIRSNGYTNNWYIGSATNNTENGANALYVSKDSGATNTYNNSSISNVWAYRDIDFGNYPEYSLSFDWKGLGESCCDYIKLFLGPPSAIPTNNNTPDNATQISENLNQKDLWTNGYFVLDTAYNGLQRLYILWHNDYSVGSNPAGALDNISIVGINCAGPQNLAIDSVTASTMLLTFSPTSVSQWQILIVPYGTAIDETNAVTINDTTYEFTGLSAATRYTIYVRTDCSGEYSAWRSISGYTACEEFMTIPLADNFDSYENNGYPLCWDRLCDYSYALPYVSNDYASSGPNTLKMTGYVDYSWWSGTTTLYDSYAIFPQVDTTAHPINTLSVFFQIYKTYSDYGNCEIGVMTDPTNDSTFTAVASLSSTDFTETETWKEFEFDLSSYTGTGTYIAIRAIASGYSSQYFYLDNVEVYPTATCAKPLNVQVTSILHDRVTFNWEPRGTETAWEIAVVPTGTDPATVTPESISERPYTKTGLTENTTYDIYVRTDCGNGETSAWSSVITFTSYCLPTAVIPYIENFDNCSTGSNADLPDCWHKFTNSSTSYPYPSDDYAVSGTQSVYYYSYSDEYAYMVSQALDLSQYAAGTLHLTCHTLKASTSGGRIDIGYMTDPSDRSTFTLLKAVYPSDYAATETWYLRDIVLHAAITEPVYLAFMVPEHSAYGMYVDSVVLNYLSDCSEPSALTVSNISTTSAEVSWTPCVYGALSYTVEYSEAGLDTWTSVPGITGSEAFLTGLTPETSYDVRLSANCSSSTTNYITTNFTTSMIPILCSDEDTLAIGTGTDQSYLIPINNFYRYTYSQQIYSATEINLPTGGTITGMSFQYAYSSSNILKDEVTIYLAHTTQNTFASTTNWIPINTATQVYSGSLACSQGWNYFEFDAPFAYNGTDNLVLIVDDNSNAYNGSSYKFYTHTATGKTLHAYSDDTNYDPANPPSGNTYGYRNNVKFFNCNASTPIACVAPNARITAVDNQSVTLEWAAGNNETSWDIEYKLTSDTTWISAGAGLTSPSQIPGLAAGSDYEVRIRSNCSPDFSNWVTLPFTVECAPVATLPLTENFDAADSSGVDYFIPCWRRGTNSSEPKTYISDESFSPNYSLYMQSGSNYYSYAASPRLDAAIAMNTLQVSFQMRKSDTYYPGFVEVGIMTNPEDISTFVSLGTATATSVSNWELFEINTDSYTGSGRYVAFRIPQWTTTKALIDDISINYIPSCPRVVGLAVNDITTNTATASWTAGGDEQTWYYICGIHGTVNVNTDAPTTINTDSAALTGLTPNTVYDFYVRGECQNGEFSPWTTVVFRTACDAVTTFPYTENFNSYAANSFPLCWYAPISFETFPYVTSSNDYYAPSALKFASLTTSPTTVTTPQLGTDIHALQVTFNLQAEYINYSGSFEVGVMSDAYDVSTFESVQIINPIDEEFHEYTIYLNQTTLTGSNNYIAFRQLSNRDNWYYWLDDVVIDSIPSCLAPTNVTFNSATTSSITIGWTETGTATAWNIEYGPTGFTQGTGTIVPAGTNPFTVPGLTASTTYDFYVQSDCGGSDLSAWSDVVTASTTCEAITAFPYTEDFENAGNMPNCWSQSYVSDNVDWDFIDGDQRDISSAHGGSYNAFFYYADNATTHSTKLVSPVFDLTQTTNPYASFWHTQAAWYSDQDVLTVYYRTNATATWTQLTQYTSDITAWTFDSLALPNPSATYQLAFEGTAAYGHGVTLDDITIASANGSATTCDAPTGLTSAVTASTATVSWTETGNFEVAYKLTSAADWSANTAVTGSTTTLTGLTANTAYDWRVRKVCDASTNSDWATGTFTTTAESSCPMPTDLAVTAVDSNSATIAWTQEAGTATEWTLNYRRIEDGATWTSSTISTNPYTIVDLLSLTSYEMQIRANCTDGTFSEYTDVVTFTTTGIDEYNLSNSISLYPNPTTSYVDVKFSDNIQVSELKVYDVYGKLLQTIAVNENPTRINVSDFADGVYFVRAITKDGIANKSFIKR